jgi:excisionase family DNA binding protein
LSNWKALHQASKPMSQQSTLTKTDFSPREVAKLTGVSKDTVLHYIHSRELFAWNSSNNPARRRYRVPLEALEKFKLLRSNPARRSPSRPR